MHTIEFEKHFNSLIEEKKEKIRKGEYAILLCDIATEERIIDFMIKKIKSSMSNFIQYDFFESLGKDCFFLKTKDNINTIGKSISLIDTKIFGSNKIIDIYYVHGKNSAYFKHKTVLTLGIRTSNNKPCFAYIDLSDLSFSEKIKVKRFCNNNSKFFFKELCDNLPQSISNKLNKTYRRQNIENIFCAISHVSKK